MSRPDARAAARAAPRAGRAGRRRGRRRGAARGQGRRRDRADRRGGQAGRRGAAPDHGAGAGRAHRARAWRSRSSTRCGTSAPSGPVRLDRRRRPARGAAARAPARREIGRDELVVIDWGAELDGYCSDCTRTVATGRARRRDARSLRARAARPSSPASSGHGRASAGARSTRPRATSSSDAGHGEHFGHGLGHGVGLEIHEAPRLSQRSDDVLAAGNVVTVEPGVYLPGRVRGADRGSGRRHRRRRATILTSVPKELVTVG